MYTLLLDTHYLDITMVLFRDGIVMDSSVKETKLDHSMFIIPMIEELLEKHSLRSEDIGEMIVVNGPGSFTGVRLGVTIGKTYAYLRNIPIYVVSYLEEMAVSMEHQDVITPFIADKNGYYTASFDADMHLVKDYEYTAKKNFDLERNDLVTDVSINYENVYRYLKEKKSAVCVHEVKPLYVKRIEVQHD